MKLTVTPELCSLIRILHTQSNIPSKELAAKMKKSPSYLSKLEGGSVHRIEETDLLFLFCLLVPGDFYSEVVPSLVRTLSTIVPAGQMFSQAWLLHFDIIRRRVALPEEMRQDLAGRFERLHTDTAAIAAHINANIDGELSDSFPENEILILHLAGQVRMNVRVHVSETELTQILQESGTKAPFFLLHCLVFTLFRFESFGTEGSKMPPELAAQTLRSTAEYLSSYGVLSSIGYSFFLSSDDFFARQLPSVSAFRSANSDLLAGVNDFFAEAIQKSPMDTSMVLKNLNELISWDPAFTLQLLSLPFAKLGNTSFRSKKQLLSDMKELLNQCEAQSELDKKWEEY